MFSNIIMSDLDKLLETSNNLTEGSIKAYKAFYKKLDRLVDGNISDTSQKKLLEVISQSDNINTQQGLINIALKIRKSYGYSVDKLEAQREINKKSLQQHVKDKNAKIKDTLPSINELYDHMDKLYEDGKWTDYIINYLLIHYFVRNEDLNFDIVQRKKQMTDKTKNYIWLDIRRKKAVYVRNKYKTAKTYGTKIYTITDENFIKALREVQKCQNKGLDCGVFIPNENQIGYYIQKATYNNLGETLYMKILVKTYSNNLLKIKEISEARLLHYI